MFHTERAPRGHEGKVTYTSWRSCIQDGGGLSKVGLQEQTLNNLQRLSLRAKVVSMKGKAVLTIIYEAKRRTQAIKHDPANASLKQQKADYELEIGLGHPVNIKLLKATR